MGVVFRALDTKLNRPVSVKFFSEVRRILQHQDDVLSVRAERVEGIEGAASVDAHDFY